MTSLPSDIDVLDFWWRAGSAKWFQQDDAFDDLCRERFGPAVDAALEGKLDHWTQSPSGALALILLLDQLTRNIHRGTPDAFAGDALALKIADQAIAAGYDRAFPPDVRVFFYLPFEHAEDMAAQERAVDLCRALDHTQYYHFALVHMDVIRRFGRFPHRNKVLGRTPTPAEEAYLADNGFSA
ncbi:hypothetical protein GCM10011316_08760 [Roseibium aquae]|uniref:DUF924 domain-containing protein n=1 Tax=Roseibium aquae TaxID=1323746 RepID=A0A916TBC9_9HYPH|nr:DUF924 family protein [Roseibium aquae]GGB38978.1 hypothetical protein GCM10011316_08760 [Roseibium aquae]